MARAHIPVEVDRRVRAAAQNRCGYCLSPQHLVMARLEIEHIIPLSGGGNNEETNLWLACPLCNRYKSDRTLAVDPETRETVPLFNPRTQTWSDHFCWSDDGLRIIGLTAVGRATVTTLHLSDDPDALEVRSYWVLAGWHPPDN
jgi:hypothetical protein